MKDHSIPDKILIMRGYGVDAMWIAPHSWQHGMRILCGREREYWIEELSKVVE